MVRTFTIYNYTLQYLSFLFDLLHFMSVYWSLCLTTAHLIKHSLFFELPMSLMSVEPTSKHALRSPPAGMLRSFRTDPNGGVATFKKRSVEKAPMRTYRYRKRINLVLTSKSMHCCMI